MKKVYLLAAFAGIIGSVSGQYAPARLQEAVESVKQKPAYKTTEKSAIIFSEDFANGLAGNNELNAAWTANGDDDRALFEYDTDGPEGAFTSADQQVVSTTVANGVMMLNGDKVNTVNGALSIQVGNITAYLESPVIPLASSSVAIEFQHAFRWCCDTDAPYFISFSFDGGTTWGSSFAISTTVATNGNSGTLTESLFLGCYLDNPTQDLSNFKFRLAHEGAGSTSHYFWAVDDVQIVDLDAVGTKTTAGYHGDIINDWDYESHSNAQAHEIVMGAAYSNTGNKSITNFGSKIEVFDANGMSVNTTTEVLSSFDICTDSAVYRSTFTPSAAEMAYTVQYSPDYADYADDSNKSDDTLTSSFEMTKGFFGHGNRWRGGSYQFDDDNGNFNEVEYGMIYRAYNDGQIFGLRTMFVNAGTRLTTADQFITYQLYQFLDPADPDPELMTLITEGDTEIDASWITTSTADQNWTHLLFDEVNIQADELYMATISGFGGADAIAIPTHGPDDDNAARAYGDLNNDGNPAWFGLASGVLVNLITDASVGVDELAAAGGEFSLSQNAPNPVVNNTNISYELVKAGKNVSLEVFDITGKMVASINKGTQAPGAHTISFDASALASGVYTYTLDVDGTRLTNRMVVSK